MSTKKQWKPVIPGFDHLLHGGDYNPDQWLHEPHVIAEDFRMMPLAGYNIVSIGIFAWSSLEPEEGRYTFEWLDDIMDRVAKAGMKAALATPSGAKPVWMSEKYPEIRRYAGDDVPVGCGGRQQSVLPGRLAGTGPSRAVRNLGRGD